MTNDGSTTPTGSGSGTSGPGTPPAQNGPQDSAPHGSAPVPELRVLVRDGATVAAEHGDLGPLDTVDLEDWYHGQRQPPNGRPYVIIGMIASIDGATTMDGLSGGLGNATDRAVLRAVRTAGRVVIVGATTARDEMYSSNNFAGQRVGVVTRSGDLNYDTDLFQSGVGFVVTTDTAPVPAGVDVVRAGSESVDFDLAFRELGSVVGDVSTVVVEGGPTVNGAVAADRVVDEICVTTAPRLIDGNSARLAHGGTPIDEGFSLAHLLFDSDGYLFARWVRSSLANRIDNGA